jgi:histidinol dehydrogenase
VFKLGGAQAIAAMAFGTGSVPRATSCSGPATATSPKPSSRSRSAGAAAIDMPAGPSEVLVIADAGADPAFVAADLLSQAEHGPDSQVLLLSDNDACSIAGAGAKSSCSLAACRVRIATQALSRRAWSGRATLDEAFEVSNATRPST